ncbi:MAG: hypothetical protein QGG67_20415 [Gammaproteobacteria bacterium]|nr:hypothetical protein [Gammaproteobacteria bacterium]
MLFTYLIEDPRESSKSFSMWLPVPEIQSGDTRDPSRRPSMLAGAGALKQSA